MSSTPLSRLRRAYGGLRRIGLCSALRILTYTLRLAWYDRRFPTRPLSLPQPPDMPTHSTESPALHLLGPVLASDWRSPTLHLHCAGGDAHITLVSDHIIRVQAAPAGVEIDAFSYAVLLDPAPTAAACRQEPAFIEVSTPAMRLRITQNPLTLHFQDAQGRDLGGAITDLGWTPAGGQCAQRLPADMHCYGLGERAFPLTLRGRRYQLYTQDPAGYAPGDDPLYINIPFLVAWHGGQMFGLLYDNPAQGALDLGAADPDSLRYQIASPHLRFDCILGPTPAALLAHYTALTGRMHLLPRWTLGYQQSRWSYETAAEVRQIAAQFRRRRLPCDAIHLDIDYMDGFRCFTWNPETFPDPTGLVADLHAQDFKVVAMIDPGIKVDPAYSVCAAGVAGDMFCKLPDGTLFHGPVWPGECYFPDFTSPRVRAWWGDLYQALVDLGIDGFWNDMNEPTVFDTKTFPNAVQHDREGLGGDHAALHGIYGMQMVRATSEGLARLRPDRRNWVFTRSGYAGVQRYATSWTGDNRSEWEDLAITPAMLMNLGLSGLGFIGPDVGGFGGAPTPELFARWISMGAFTPFYRAHTVKDSPPQEPWAYGAEVEEIARAYLGWRYRLLPYLYTALWQCAQSGLPIMRPLFFEDTTSPAYLTCDDQWLLGDHLLISPVLEAGAATRRLHLPPGAWYDFWSDQRLTGPAQIDRPAPLDVVPVHVRAGAVLPLGPLRQFAHESPAAAMQLHLYPGQGRSLLYEDDGDTLAYQQGHYRLSQFDMTWTEGRLTLIRTLHGAYQPPYDTLEIHLHGHTLQAAQMDETPLSLAPGPLYLPDAGWRALTLTLSASKI
ncbi:MAG: DUF4968 domain-containing protein [Caldilineales bacterium]|nr:DUF4968 domain-containing protein [Caldilineales bacterium]